MLNPDHCPVIAVNLLSETTKPEEVIRLLGSSIPEEHPLRGALLKPNDLLNRGIIPGYRGLNRFPVPHRGPINHYDKTGTLEDALASIEKIGRDTDLFRPIWFSPNLYEALDRTTFLNAGGERSLRIVIVSNYNGMYPDGDDVTDNGYHIKPGLTWREILLGAVVFSTGNRLPVEYLKTRGIPVFTEQIPTLK